MNNTEVALTSSQRVGTKECIQSSTSLFTRFIPGTLTPRNTSRNDTLAGHVRAFFRKIMRHNLLTRFRFSKRRSFSFVWQSHRCCSQRSRPPHSTATSRGPQLSGAAGRAHAGRHSNPQVQQVQQHHQVTGVKRGPSVGTSLNNVSCVCAKRKQSKSSKTEVTYRIYLKKFYFHSF